jgi:hypothetical protein
MCVHILSWTLARFALITVHNGNPFLAVKLCVGACTCLGFKFDSGISTNALSTFLCGRGWGLAFLVVQPMMTLYLTDMTPPEEIEVRLIPHFACSLSLVNLQRLPVSTTFTHLLATPLDLDALHLSSWWKFFSHHHALLKHDCMRGILVTMLQLAFSLLRLLGKYLL